MKVSFLERRHQEVIVLVRRALCYILPIILSNGILTVETAGLLDTGASVNVLPYEIGLELGAVWEEQTVPIELSRNLSREPARGLVLSGKVAQFDSVLFAFAWTKLKNVPII